MADILVQNAVQEVANTIAVSGAGINYKSVLGSDLNTYIGNMINANPTDGPYTVPAGGGSANAGTVPICQLSSYCCISHCTCNFSGSGQTSTVAICGTVDNVWRGDTVLVGGDITITKTVTEIRTKILGLTADGLLLAVYDLDAAQGAKDINTAYISYYDAGLSADILENWYGIVPAAAPVETAGARLSSTNFQKVCGTLWKAGEGGSCTWTVPAGATRLKFQVWGAGKGSNPGCCCGGDAGAHTGAYSELTMDAVPGEAYTICAGCSCSTYLCSNSNPGNGCQSGVTGPGICCLMADGGHCYNANCGSMNAMRCCFGTSACQRNQNPYCTTSGPCWCGNGEYCFDNSCSTCGVVPVYPSCCDNTSCWCTCAEDTRNAPANPEHYGHHGIHGGMCLDTNNYGYHIRPPVIDADTGKMYPDTSGCYCQNFTSGSCCGGCNGKDWDFHPGHGGAGTHIMAGANSHKGDTGRGGMVQISWF